MVNTLVNPASRRWFWATIQPERLWPNPWTRTTGVSRAASPHGSGRRTMASSTPSGYHHAQRAELITSWVIPICAPGRNHEVVGIPTRTVFAHCENLHSCSEDHL